MSRVCLCACACVYNNNEKIEMSVVERSKCRRCVVIYEKHKNVLQYKESECDDMYMDQSNHPVSNPLPIRTMQKSSELNNNNHNSNSRGGAHPNTNGGHSRSSSDQYLFRSNDDIDNCKHQLFDILYIYLPYYLILISSYYHHSLHLTTFFAIT